MDVLVVAILSGIAYGVVLFLTATGLSLVLGLMGIVNLAHGALFMTGAYTGVMVAKSTGNFILGILAGAALAVIVGLIIERGFLRRLYGKQLEQIVLTFGFVYIITNVHLWIYGGWARTPFIPSILSRSIPIGAFNFPIYRLVIIIIGVALCLGLWWFQEKTKMGAIIRAGMDDTEMVLGLGINLTPINIGAFCLGAFLAGFAGVIGAPIIGGLNLESGTDIFLLALGVVIVGGVGSVQGSLVGALLIGITTILVQTYFPIMAMFVVYILMIIILIFKPSGLLGRK